MATVTDWVASSRAESDRAQLVLVGALALAVSLVVLAVVLNSAIYTENLASRSGESGAEAAIDVRQSVRDGVGGSTDRVNRNHAGDDYGTLSGTHLSAAMDEWRPMIARQQVVAGRTLRVATDGSTEGTRIADESVGEFTPQTAGANPLGYGTPNWLVASPVEVRQFRLGQVSASDLTGTTPVSDPETASDVFVVEVRDTADTDRWQVAVYRNTNTGDVEVSVWDDEAGSHVGTCATSASTARLDLTGASLNGQHCEPLTFLGELDGLAAIYYANADSIRGTYELTVDRTGHATGGPLKDRADSVNYGQQCSGPTYADSPASAGSGPYASGAIYSATVDFRYVSDSVTYETDVRAAHGEPGPPADYPVVTDLSVSDASGSDASFDVSWSVRDPNGDLDAVRVELQQGGSTVTAVSSGVGGASASGSATVTDPSGGGATYTVVVEVTDDEGDSRASSERHAADGDNSGCPP